YHARRCGARRRSYPGPARERLVTLIFPITLVLRYLLVMLFLPFSALDKIINFKGAVAQARESIPSDSAARLAIVAALCIEIIMPLGILTGVADRLAALIMAGYCGITAMLWKQFWKPGDFWAAGGSRGRDLFWDFLKSFPSRAGSCSSPSARTRGR